MNWILGKCNSNLKGAHGIHMLLGKFTPICEQIVSFPKWVKVTLPSTIERVREWEWEREGGRREGGSVIKALFFGWTKGSDLGKFLVLAVAFDMVGHSLQPETFPPLTSVTLVFLGFLNSTFPAILYSAQTFCCLSLCTWSFGGHLWVLPWKGHSTLFKCSFIHLESKGGYKLIWYWQVLRMLFDHLIYYY